MYDNRCGSIVCAKADFGTLPNVGKLLAFLMAGSAPNNFIGILYIKNREATLLGWLQQLHDKTR